MSDSSQRDKPGAHCITCGQLSKVGQHFFSRWSQPLSGRSPGLYFSQAACLFSEPLLLGVSERESQGSFSLLFAITKGKDRPRESGQFPGLPKAGLCYLPSGLRGSYAGWNVSLWRNLLHNLEAHVGTKFTESLQRNRLASANLGSIMLKSNHNSPERWLRG